MSVVQHCVLIPLDVCRSTLSPYSSKCLPFNTASLFHNILPSSVSLAVMSKCKAYASLCWKGHSLPYDTVAIDNGFITIFSYHNRLLCAVIYFSVDIALTRRQLAEKFVFLQKKKTFSRSWTSQCWCPRLSFRIRRHCHIFIAKESSIGRCLCC